MLGRGVGAAAVALLVLVVLPSVGACTTTGTLPDPAQFVLWDPATGSREAFTVHQVSIGADCRLANAFAGDGQSFLWVGGHAPRFVVLHHPDLPEPLIQEVPPKAELGLNAGRVLVLWPSREPPQWRAGSWDAGLGDWRSHALPEQAGGTWTLTEGVAVWRGADGGTLLFDPLEARVLASGADGSWPRAGDRLRLFGSQIAVGLGADGWFAFRYATGERHRIDAGSGAVVLAVQGLRILWSTASGQLRLGDLESGLDLAIDPPMRALGLGGDRVVLGRMGASGTGATPAPWTEPTVPAPLPPYEAAGLPMAALAGVALTSAAWARRTRFGQT